MNTPLGLITVLYARKGRQESMLYVREVYCTAASCQRLWSVTQTWQTRKRPVMVSPPVSALGIHQIETDPRVVVGARFGLARFEPDLVVLAFLVDSDPGVPVDDETFGADDPGIRGDQVVKRLPVAAQQRRVHLILQGVDCVFHGILHQWVIVRAGCVPGQAAT